MTATMALNANFKQRVLLDLLGLLGNELYSRLYDDFTRELEYAAWRYGRLVLHLSSDLHGSLGVYTLEYGSEDRCIASAMFLEARPGGRITLCTVHYDNKCNEMTATRKEGISAYLHRLLSLAVYKVAKGAQDVDGEESDDDEGEDGAPPPPPPSDASTGAVPPPNLPESGPPFAPPPSPPATAAPLAVPVLQKNVLDVEIAPTIPLVVATSSSDTAPPPSTTSVGSAAAAAFAGTIPSSTPVASLSIPTISSVSGGKPSSIISSLTVRDDRAASASVPPSTPVVSSSVPLAAPSSSLVPLSLKDVPSADASLAPSSRPLPPSTAVFPDQSTHVEQEHTKAGSSNPTSLDENIDIILPPSHYDETVHGNEEESFDVTQLSPLPNWAEDDERWPEERRRRMEHDAIVEARRFWGEDDTSERCIVFSRRYDRALPLWVIDLWDSDRRSPVPTDGEEGREGVEMPREADVAAERWEIDGDWTDPLMDMGPLVDDDAHASLPLSPIHSLLDEEPQKDKTTATRKRAQSPDDSSLVGDGPSPSKRAALPEYVVEALAARDRLLEFIADDHTISRHSNTITSRLADDELVSFWRSLSATLRLRNGLVETNAHLAISRFSIEYIKDPKNEEIVKEFTDATIHILDRMVDLTDIVRAFSRSIHEENEEMVEEGEDGVVENNEEREMMRDVFITLAKKHLMDVKEWKKMTINLPQ